MVSAHPLQELEAFCHSCPQPYEVTDFLDTLGFTPGFEMAARASHDQYVPALPAQYHYERDDGMSIIYLAGRDSPMQGEHFPAHNSRFFAYAGADSAAFGWTTRAIAVKWNLAWQHTVSSEPPAHDADVA
jgi:hypothetical protein